MRFRAATLVDADLLRGWRNDPDTRAMSRNTAAVGETEHHAWLIASLESPFRNLWIAEHRGQPIGTLRVDWNERPELSWTVCPRHRGRGLGKRMVTDYARTYPASYHAEIKAENIASQRIADAAGLTIHILES